MRTYPILLRVPISWNDLHKELKTIEEDEGLMHLLIEGSGGVHGGGAGAEGEVGGASVAVFALPPAEGGEEVGKERGVGDGEAGVEDLFGALKVEDEEEAGEDLLEGEDGSYLLRRKRERWEARDAFSLFSNLLCSSLTSRSRSLSLSLSLSVCVCVCFFTN